LLALPALLALLAATVPGVALQAATISVSAERRGDTIDIEASAQLDADPAIAWTVLTGYERYPEFIPDLRSSRVVSRQGSVVTVEQSGHATLWLLRMPLDITFEVTESPPYRLQSRAVAGSLRAMSSRYQLSPAGRGVRLDYSGRIAPGFRLLAPIERIAVQSNIARQFQALADEIERRGAAAR
jgi:ribosome-associated toxin RatA of RatAB toxin-antitoxin module